MMSKRCDLLLALGQALWPAGETERVIAHVAPDAFALAEKHGDRSRAFRACRLALDCLQAQGALVSSGPEYLPWAELAHGYANPDSTERLYADLCTRAWPWSRSLTHVDGEKPAHCSRRRWRSLDNMDDAEALFRSAFSLLLTSPPQHWGSACAWRRRLRVGRARGSALKAWALVLWFARSLSLRRG